MNKRSNAKIPKIRFHSNAWMFKKEIIHQNRLFFALYQWGGWVMVLEKGKKFLS